MARILIGVMGPGEGAIAAETATAYALGRAIAQQGWGVLMGGRASGVMAAAAQGAHSAGGWVVGILPSDTPKQLAAAVDIPILTGLGQARNVVNVLSSRVVIACGLGAGTLSEIALAVKLRRPLILMHSPAALEALLQPLASTPLWREQSVTRAIRRVHQVLGSDSQAAAD